MNQKPIRAEDAAILEELNNAVNTATEARRRWLDSKMAEYALVPIGEDIYDLSNGKLLGVVTGYYRYHQDDPRFDDNFAIEYTFAPDRKTFNFTDNTSRFGHIAVGTFQDFVGRRRSELRQLEAWHAMQLSANR